VFVGFAFVFLMIFVRMQGGIIVVAASAMVAVTVIECTDMSDTRAIAPVASGESKHLRPPKRE
jgi:hypothetical protein